MSVSMNTRLRDALIATRETTGLSMHGIHALCSQKTLLDEFAGQALAGIKLTKTDGPLVADDELRQVAAMVATGAYAIADAMLAEKARREEGQPVTTADRQPPF